MIPALLLGAGFGLGLFCLALAVRARRPGLSVVLARLESTPTAQRSGQPDLTSRFARRSAQAMEVLHLGAPCGSEADVRVLRRSPESLAAERLTVALAGAVLGVACSEVLAVSGLAPPLGLRLAVPVLLGVGGAFLPLFTMRSVAAQRRREARATIATFLDLVGVALSGGSGVEEAMVEAARIGQGWAFEELDGALGGARRSGEPPWRALERLGAELGISELTELGATLSLAGTEGARARDSLVARARSLRRDQLAQAEGRALRRTETAHLPLVLQLVGFVALLLYPAFVRLMAGLS